MSKRAAQPNLSRGARLSKTARAQHDGDSDDQREVEGAARGTFVRHWLMGDIRLHELCVKSFDSSTWQQFHPENLHEFTGEEYEQQQVDAYPLSLTVRQEMVKWAKQLLSEKGVDCESSVEGDDSSGEEEESEEESGEESGEESEEEFDGDAALGVLGDMCRSAIVRQKIGKHIRGAIKPLKERDTRHDSDSDDDDDDDDGDENFKPLPEDDGDTRSDDAMSVVSDGSGFDVTELAAISSATSRQPEDVSGTVVAQEPAASSSTAIVPANMDDTAIAALNVANDEPVDYSEEDTDKSRLATCERRIRALKSQVATVCVQNSSLREANATLCHALRQANIPIPHGCEQTAQALGQQLALQAGASPLLAGIAPPPPNLVVPDDAPIRDKFCMRQLWLPDTSTITSSTKFKLNGKVWPHAICTYQRLSDELAPVVEADSKQVIEFRCTDKSDSTHKVTENDLKPGSDTRPMIKFKLELIYDDVRPGSNEEKVTVQSLSPSYRERVRVVAAPPFLNDDWTAPMYNGRIKFNISSLNVRSGMTDPAHRKFRYKLTAVDDEFAFLNTYSPSFYVMAKAWKIANRNVVAATYD